MNMFKLILFCLVSTVSLAADVETEDNVLVLTDDNFDEVVNTNEFVLVEFYAPWCGHCKALTPEYAKAATKFAEEESDVKLAKVDATVHTKVAAKFEVRGYPTLKFFKNGKDSEYQGGRTADEIYSWLRKKTGPPTTSLATVEDFETFKSGNDVVVVAYFSNMESDAAVAYVKVASSVDDVPFAIVTDASVASDDRVKMSDNDVNMHRQFDLEDGSVVAFDGELNAEKLDAFVKENKLPLVSEFTQESAPKIFGGEIQVHNLLFIKKSSDNFDEIYAAFKGAASQFKTKVLFIYIDADKDDNMRVLEFFGLSADDCPSYRMIKMANNMEKFKPEAGDITTDSIVAFTQGVLDGKITRHLMSEEPPTEEYKPGNVKVLVGKTFKEVYNKDKKYFVEFYAPWCGHCKQLAPIWDQLADAFKDKDDVVIAKMDSTANELADVEIQGFPTLKYFPGGDGDKVLDYNGERTLDALKAYVESDGSDEQISEDDVLDQEDFEEDDVVPEESEVNPEQKDEL